MVFAVENGKKSALNCWFLLYFLALENAILLGRDMKYGEVLFSEENQIVFQMCKVSHFVFC